MVAAERALPGRVGVVLGAGGERAIPWETGVLAGFLEAGLDLRAAASVVGTSAGAFVAARLTAGHDPLVDATMLARQPPEAPAALASGSARWALERLTVEWAASAELAPAARRRRLGCAALRTGVISETDHVAMMMRRVGTVRFWPRALRLAALDAATGDRVMLDAGTGICVGRGVAAARAVPMLLPPVTVGERRCMDAAVDSGTNCDHLRDELDLAIVVSPIAPDPPPGSWDEAWAQALARELDELHEHVAEVVVVAAGPGDDEAMGDNLFSAATAEESCAAGRDRGRAAAESVGALA